MSKKVLIDTSSDKEIKNTLISADSSIKEAIKLKFKLT